LPASTSYVPIPYSVDLYDQIATFWTAPQSSYWTCGVVVAEVDTKTRKELGSNRGVLVDVVVTGTPAFHADILEGDVLLSINRKPIFGAAAIKSLCDSYRGEDVIFEVYRDGRNISLAARLNAN
jgi:S1-C subfamily serine protease